MNGLNLTRLHAVARKELLQLRRDRLTVAMIIGIPLMQMLLFGYAINNDVRHVPTLVVDHDHSREGRELVAKLQASTAFEIVGYAEDDAAVERAFREGRARTGLVIPPGFGRDLTAGRGAHAQLLVDGSDPQASSGAAAAAVAIGQRLGAQEAATLAARIGRGGPTTAYGIVPATLYNPDRRTAVFVVPGLIGVILTMTMVLFTSMAIARERERGTLEQLIVSPVTRSELMAGKLLPYVAIGYVQVTIVLLVARLVFDVPLRGSLGLLYLLAFAFIASVLAVGLVFSTIAKNQQQAMQLSFFYLLPNILMSGFAFPWEGMPRPAQWLSQMLPLTHFLRIVRAILLKGGTWADVAGEFGWLAAILAVLLTVATVRFRKQLG